MALSAPTRLRQLLLEHYDTHRRDLPWRENQEPYRVWVSEIMLQQTRVETAIPYYDRWMERFPTVEGLGGPRLLLAGPESPSLGPARAGAARRGDSPGLAEPQDASGDRRVHLRRDREHRLRGGGASRRRERAARVVSALRPRGSDRRELTKAGRRARRSRSARGLEPGAHGVGSVDLPATITPLRTVSGPAPLCGRGITQGG